MEHVALMQALRASYRRIDQQKRVLLGFSGGSDSAALLHALIVLKEETGLELYCVHVNHGLRIESDEEEAKIRELTDSYKIPLYVQRVTIPRDGNLEASARAARYQVFNKALQHFQADVLALAHHSHDQAETVLMHLMRGSGAQGLSGMREWAAPVWRPLLSVSKNEINQYLEAHQINWLEDSSNDDTVFFRNYLRHNILSNIERRQEGSIRNISRTAGILSDEQHMWRLMEDQFLDSYAKMIIPFVYIEKQPLLTQHVALQRRLVRRLAEYNGLSLSFEQTESLLAILKQEDNVKYQLSKDLYAFTTLKRLHILPEDVHSMSIPWQQPQVLRDYVGLGDGVHEQTLDARFLDGAVMRQVHRDDRMTPLGMKGSQSLRKYLSGKGIDEHFRPFWPVYARDNRVLWVPGCGVSQDASVSPATTQTITLRFVDLLPDEIKRRQNGYV